MSRDDEAVVYVSGGRTARVDTAHLRVLVDRVGAALGQAESARSHLQLAYGAVMPWMALAPTWGAAAAAGIENLISGRRGVNRQIFLLTRIREALERSIEQYTASEMTLSRAIQQQVIPGIPAWLIPLRPFRSVVVEHASQVWDAISLPGDEATKGAYAQMLLNIGPLALWLGELANPGRFGRSGSGTGPGSAPADPGSAGTGAAGVGAGSPGPDPGLAGVPFLSSTLLRMTGLDNFHGNYDVYLRRPDMHMLVARLKGSVGPNPLSLASSAGSRIKPVGSFEELFEYTEDLSEESKQESAGMFSAIRTESEEGDVAWLMAIPGTREKFAHTNPQDHLSNLQMMAGGDSDLYESVRTALLTLPVEEVDQVSFVGHSQGGILSMLLAADPVVQSHLGGVDFVVTAGSPVGQVTGVPQETRVLNLVNADDWLAGLAGVSPAISKRHVTVVVDHQVPIVDSEHAHDLVSYNATIEAARHEVDFVDGWFDEFEADHWSEGGEQTEFVFEFTREDMDSR